MKKRLLLFVVFYIPSWFNLAAIAQVDRVINDASRVIGAGVGAYSTFKSLFPKKPKPVQKVDSPTAPADRRSTKVPDVYTPETTDRGASTVEAMQWYQKSDEQTTAANKIELLNKAIKADPAFVDAYYNRAYYLGELKLYDKAIADLDRVLSLRPNDAAALNDRGYFKLALNQYDNAVQDFGQSIANNFENLSLAFKNRGMAYMGLGGENLPNALRDFDNALLHKPDFIDAQYAKATCLQEMDKHKESLALLNQLVMQDSKNMNAWYLRGVSNAALRQDQEAINDYSNVLKQAPDYVDAFFARAIVKMTMENFDGAIDDYTQVIRLDKTFAEAYNNRGFCYLKKKKKEFELAIRDFTESINQGHPDKYLVYTNRGDAQFRLGAYTDAKKDYQLALLDRKNYAPALQGMQSCDNMLNPGAQKAVAARQSNLLKRYALVIGNSKYVYSKPLEGKPLNDADDIAQRLDDLGFTVTKLTDATLIRMNESIDALTLQAKEADLVTVFFAGHGIEDDGKNYLIPIDARLNKPEDAQREALLLDNLLSRLKSSRARMNLVFLDACRNYPFRSWDALGRDTDSTTMARVRAFAAPPKLSPDVMVYYATQPKDVAGNGNSRNGNLTQGLLKHLRRGTELKEMWQEVTNSVYHEITKEIQLPYSAGTLTMDLTF